MARPHVFTIVLAGGEGKRLRTTSTITPVADRPVLVFVIEQMHRDDDRGALRRFPAFEGHVRAALSD